MPNECIAAVLDGSPSSATRPLPGPPCIAYCDKGEDDIKATAVLSSSSMLLKYELRCQRCTAATEDLESSDMQGTKY